MRDLMPDPNTLLDMDAAVRRLVRAVRRGETVAVFGDYDVDGAASAALLAGYLRGVGLRAPIHIPDRITEGYGPNIAAITALAAAICWASTCSRLSSAVVSRSIAATK